MSDKAGEKPLSKKHQAFVTQWLQRFNGTEAYMATYPNAAYDSARVGAAQLLAKPNIASAIQDGLDRMHMSVEEALKLQADIARGDMGNLASGGAIMSLEEAKSLGLSKLIKRYKQKTETIGDKEVEWVEVELYSAAEAIRDVLKVHGRFADKVDVDTSGEIVVRVVYGDKGANGSAADSSPATK